MLFWGYWIFSTAPVASHVLLRDETTVQICKLNRVFVLIIGVTIDTALWVEGERNYIKAITRNNYHYRGDRKKQTGIRIVSSLHDK